MGTQSIKVVVYLHNEKYETPLVSPKWYTCSAADLGVVWVVR